MLCREGLPKIGDLYGDATRIEANTNCYPFVWGKAIKTSRERTAKQLQERKQPEKGLFCKVR